MSSSTVERAVEASTRRRALLSEKHRPLVVAYGLIVVMLIVAGIRHPGFVEPGNLRNQLVLASFLGIAAAGQTILILTGGIDLSLAWNLNFSAILMTQLTKSDMSAGNVTRAIFLALLSSCVVGFINGLGVAYLRIPSLVMTLGMNTVLLGLTLYYTKGTPQGTAPNVILDLATGRIFGIPWALILWAIISVVVIFVLRRSVYGRRVYAIGNNVRAAYLSGVPVRGVLLASYTVAGLFAGITGLLLTGYSNQSYIRMGDDRVLPSIAAVVVGGTSILGGSGGYAGTIAGAILITLLQNVLAIENIGQADQQILFGLIVLVMLFIYGREGKVRE
ncbi:MAG TPA: ABC transporter permease [Thermomicrobiales bacterium]|nr:ABC transporter permease [Thermomicrobiales bacterium]